MKTSLFLITLALLGAPAAQAADTLADQRAAREAAADNARRAAIADQQAQSLRQVIAEQEAAAADARRAANTATVEANARAAVERATAQQLAYERRLSELERTQAPATPPGATKVGGGGDVIIQTVRPAARAMSEAEYRRQYEASKTRAAEIYGFVSQPDSPAAQRMAEVELLMKEYGDPVFNDPNKPLIVAQMVAKEMSIAPRKTTPPAPPVKP